MAAHPVLLVEGQYDQQAMPSLIVKAAQSAGIFDLYPKKNPIRTGDIPSLLKTDKLTRYALHALERNGDGVFWVLDCDDFCAVESARYFVKILLPIVKRCNKPFALCFLVKEYESLFLADYPAVFERAGVRARKKFEFDPTLCEDFRDAKGILKQIMGRNYRPMRFQSKLTNELDIKKAQQHSRSLRHLVSAVKWYASVNKQGKVYPNAL